MKSGMKNNVLQSWNQNAHEWINLLDRSGIPSRRITNDAIINTVSNYAGPKILDLGCGDGWLTRTLGKIGFDVVGLDGTDTLVQHARTLSNQTYVHMSYEDIIDGSTIPEAPFDTIVFNYSLYGEEDTKLLLQSLLSVLVDQGNIIIQTVHPLFLLEQGQSYTSRWIDDAWCGLDGNFTLPHKWFARTMEDWVQLFIDSGYHLHRLTESKSVDNIPVSVIFVVGRRA